MYPKLFDRVICFTVDDGDFTETPTPLPAPTKFYQYMVETEFLKNDESMFPDEEVE